MRRNAAPDAVLVLADGIRFYGRALGAPGTTIGEVVFNTAMTGYQEVLTDPSYAGQLVAFTFPHIGNVGTNHEDDEAPRSFARGLILRHDPTSPSNHRSMQALNDWLVAAGLTGIAGIDTRRLTRHLRDHGAQNGGIAHFDPAGSSFDVETLAAKTAAAPSMVGRDLASEVTCLQRYGWNEGLWLGDGFNTMDQAGPHVVAIDYGAKRNILRHLADRGFRVTVVPASVTADEVIGLNPDGLFLSNGPGDPTATGAYAVPELRKLLARDIPTFGICLGHQLLALALGGHATKMPFGHHGANHPVQDLRTGKVEITSQNHGFAIDPTSLPEAVEVTHRSLFDGTVEGLSHRHLPVFSVQYHPEAAPGPQESAYLFDRFTDLIGGSR